MGRNPYLGRNTMSSPANPFINHKSFSHYCRYGTKFTASRCDFRDGVEVSDVPETQTQFACDVAEMIGYHAVNIRPELNGFQGYDCINWIIK